MKPAPSVTFLGTGGAWGVPEHGCTCRVCREMLSRGESRTRTALLWRGTETLLIDCGPDIRHQMRTHDVPRPDAVLITHEHGDHYLGLDELLCFRRCAPRERFVPIPLYATAETFETIESRFGYLFGTTLEKRLARPGEPLSGLASKVTPFKTYHGELARGSVGYVVEDRGYKLCYTSDFSRLPEEPEMVKGADVLVMQCYWLNEPSFNRPNHMSLQNAIPYLHRWTPCLTVLTHISDQDCVPGDPANNCLKKIPANAPLVPPGRTRPYPIPLCQEHWEELVARIARDYALETVLRVSQDGLVVPLDTRKQQGE